MFASHPEWRPLYRLDRLGRTGHLDLSDVSSPEKKQEKLAGKLLGAYTTFSTFSFETQTLIRTGRAATALIYVGVSVVTGVVAAAAGYVTARGFV